MRNLIGPRFRRCWARVPDEIKPHYQATIEAACRNELKRYRTSLGLDGTVIWAVRTEIGSFEIITTFQMLKDGGIALLALSVKNVL